MGYLHESKFWAGMVVFEHFEAYAFTFELELGLGFLGLLEDFIQKMVIGLSAETSLKMVTHSLYIFVL